MNLTAHIGNVLIHLLATLTLKIGPFPLDQISEKGPLILICNHVNFVDGPIVLNRMSSRPVTIMAKIETWKNPLFGSILDGWDGISIRRGEADLEAFRKAQQALADGKILILFPEGTRSEYKGLGPGHAGVVLLAARSGAPIQAVGLYNHRGFWNKLYRGFKRVPLNFSVGKPFKVNLNGAALSRDVRQQITDEIMYQLATVLPPDYRGVYADLSKATQKYIEPID
jgi:1-acyl-sn-glycerol-3-phosphate acyltransferase